MEHVEPRLTVVIPCYNEARFIGRTLKSLQNQNFSGSYEIIIVDNNCNDETVAIASTYGVRIVKEERPGVCWARQAGTEAARGEIVISTDADTVQPPDWLSNIDRSFRQHRRCVAVAGPCAYIDGPWWGKQYTKFLFGSISFGCQIIGRPYYVTATNIAFKKTAWTQYHPYLTQGGDELALLHDLRRRGKVIFDNKNPVYTSGRRLDKGLAYNVFVSFMVYYLLAYYVNRFAGRTIIGTAPTFRTIGSPTRSRVIALYRAAFLILIIAVVHLPRHDTILQQTSESFAKFARYLY